MKIEQMPYMRIGYVDTPLELMPNLTKKLGKGNLYIKRDDMTGLALGGNKVRKLDYLVQYAKSNGYTALMTFGGVQTNHGRLTVAAAIKAGLKPILVLKGSKPEYCSGNLILDRLMGADIYFIDTDDADDLPEEERQEVKKNFLDECTKKILENYESQGEKVLNIPVGGQGVIGSAGYIQAIQEIMKQMKEQQINAKYLIAGYGSTGTFAGLVAGAKYYNAPFEVIGIPIEPDYRPIKDTVNFVNELSEFYNMGFKVEEKDIHLEFGIDDNFYGGTGYNEPDHVTQSYIEMLAKEEAIFVDPCYTGKVFNGFINLITSGKIPSNADVIMLHTGGAPGLWTKEHLDSMQEVYWSNNKNDHVSIMKLKI